VTFGGFRTHSYKLTRTLRTNVLLGCIKFAITMSAGRHLAYLWRTHGHLALFRKGKRNRSELSFVF